MAAYHIFPRVWVARVVRGSTHSFLCLVISLSRVGPVSTLDWDLTLHVPQRRENLPSRDTQGEGNGR